MRRASSEIHPVVGVVVLNYNGGDMTVACFESLTRTDWPKENLQLVLVDNGSSDGVVPEIRRAFPNVRIIESRTNLGFAGGCNLGMESLDGVDYVGLVNNDAVVTPDWLAPLVSELESDPSLGAACPRILFMHQYIDIHLSSPTSHRGKGDLRELGVRISGLRVGGEDRWRDAQFVDGFWGREQTSDGGDALWAKSTAHLRAPILRGQVGATTCELLLSTDQKFQDKLPLTIRTASSSSHHLIGPESEWYSIELDSEPIDVINNVGTLLTPQRYGADRGYLEPSEGRYLDAEEVFAWCGAAVLLPRRYLDEVGTFDERFFLYYEDFELSWRGRERGWRYSYVPTSIVWHRHSATTIEGSKLAERYNLRNRLLTLMLHESFVVVLACLLRYVLTTASYARRDIVSPLLRSEPVRTMTVRLRIRSLLNALLMWPAMLLQRRANRLTASQVKRLPAGRQ